jgi:hypothetical protein
MRRFQSLNHVPVETRRILRDRFARYLRAQFSEAVEPTRGALLPDELLLNLLLNLEVDFESDVERAKAAYAAALPENSTEPSFDEALAAGWFRVVWGRITTPFEVAREVNRRRGSPLTALAALFRRRFEQKVVLSEAARSNPELAPLVAQIERGELTPENVRGQDPRWVAARLWDRSLPGSGNHSDMLRTWLDLWRLLGSPKLVPTDAWGEAAGMAFFQTAIAMLEGETSLVGWEETRSGFARQMALGRGQEPSSMERYIPAVPESLLDRAQWLEDLRLERAVVGSLDAYDAVFGLVRLLLEQVAHQGNAQAPHWLAGRLLELALERAELFLAILFHARLHPVLLADLALYPPTSALACLLIAQWRTVSGAWDRELGVRDDETTKAFAFADAVSVMGHFLEKGLVPPREAAALLNFLHKAAQPRFIDESKDGDSLLAILRGELISQTAEKQTAIYMELASFMPEAGLGSSVFASALDVLAAGQLASSVDPKALIDAYASSVAIGGYGLSASGIGVSAAVSLVELAMKASPDLRARFFSPIDMKARIAAASAPDANPYTVNDDTARSIRAHLRILCRAVAGLMESAPDELTGALITTVRIGALSHAERSRVAAFAARFETDPYRGRHDRPIATDLGAALNALVGEPRGKLLATILEIDEPMVLAQLLSYAPHTVRDRIRARIADVTPSDAGEMRSLPEAQARIDALLSAGLADSAAQFIQAERELKTLGKVRGREVVRIRAALALKLQRGDWAGIASAEPPPELTGQEKDAALEAISFFRALAALYDPAGDRQGATQVLRQLQSCHPQVGGYTINLFAAEIASLLGTDLFGQLYGRDLVHGRQVLADAEHAIRRLRTISAQELEIFNANKALLLLALGHPDRAHEVLSSLQVERLGERTAAYSAIALARMGRVSESMAVLDRADGDFGKTDIVNAARTHIESGKRFAALPNLSSEVDPIPRLKAAFWDFGQLDHFRQSEVSGESFESLAINHVRSAADAITSLVPMMKSISMNSHEDDLNALIGTILAARLLPLGWTVSDQSRGGFTAIGRPGERDLIIQKSGTLLAIIEALKCDQPLTHKAMRDELAKHFLKLLGYGQCNAFFHLTYSYLPNPADVLDHLRTMAEKNVLAGYTYVGREEIPRTDSRPVGFIARYKTDSGELIAVVFLVLDMEQSAQRAAGKAGRQQ